MDTSRECSCCGRLQPAPAPQGDNEHFICKGCAAALLEARIREKTMKRQWESRLWQDYPFMEHYENGTRARRCIQVSCGSGWYHLIREMCWEIKEWLAQAGTPHLHQFRMAAIREKYGTLVACAAGAVPEEIWEILSGYENKSEQVCEACGAPGSLHESRGRWLKTLCSACAGSGLYKISGYRILRGG